MKLRKKVVLFMSLVLIISGLIFPQALAIEATPTITIDFSNPTDLAKYFSSVNGAGGNWEVVDGILKQTTEYAMAPSVQDNYQALELKGQLLQDYVIEFDYYQTTAEEVVDEAFANDNGKLYARRFHFVTNLETPGEMVSETNSGLGWLMFDSKTSGVRSVYAFKQPGDPLSATDKLYWAGKFHNPAGGGYADYELGGPIRFKYVKSGNTLEIWVNNSIIYGGSVGTITEPNGDFNTIMNGYARKGAVQFFSENGVSRIDNLTITSADLDVSKFVLPMPSVTIDFSDPADLAKYFSSVNGAGGNWEVVDGILKQTNEYVMAPTAQDNYQALELKGQLLQNYVIEFDYYQTTAEEVVDEAFANDNGKLYARRFHFVTNLETPGEMVSETNSGLGWLMFDSKTSGVRSVYAFKQPGDPLSATDKLYWAGKFHNPAGGGYADYELGGPIRFKYVKSGNTLEIWVNNSIIYGGSVGTIAEPNGNFNAIMDGYARKGAVQFFSENGVSRIDNLTIASYDLDISLFVAPSPTVTPEPTAVPTATPEPTAVPTLTPSPTAVPTVTPEPAVVPAAVETVITMIGLIPETITLSDEDSIVEARAAYDSLTAEQKALVTNYEELVAAEQYYASLKNSGNPTPGDSNGTKFIIIMLILSGIAITYGRKTIKVK